VGPAVVGAVAPAGHRCLTHPPAFPTHAAADALATLRDRPRAAIVLRYYADLPDAAIAEILGCRLPTVRTTIHRALVALRREIDR
jgi:DNA-directed RNA polymerase specialized sigma24 family protein